MCSRTLYAEFAGYLLDVYIIDTGPYKGVSLFDAAVFWTTWASCSIISPRIRTKPLGEHPSSVAT
eukprot:2113966-Pyramimonas_sp.AAC.1